MQVRYTQVECGASEDFNCLKLERNVHSQIEQASETYIINVDLWTDGGRFKLSTIRDSAGKFPHTNQSYLKPPEHTAKMY